MTRNWNGASRPGVMKTLLPLAFSALLIAGCAAPETSLRVKRSTSRSGHVESVLRTLSSLLSLLSATLGHIQSARFEVLLRHQILDARINSCRKAPGTAQDRFVGPKAAAAFIKSTYSGLPWRAPKSQTTVYHLQDFEAEPRHATLVAILIDTETRKLG